MADRPSTEKLGEADTVTIPSGRGELSEDEISLLEIWNIVWTGKWRIIGVTLIAAVLSVAYAIYATEWYRAEVLLAPTAERNAPALPTQLGGIAALAGVSIGGDDSVEAVATLKSREFARGFIEDLELLPVLFADLWDADKHGWVVDDPRDQPDIRDAVKLFHDEILRVSEDRATGLVTLAVEWTDPEVAARWATVLVERLNSIMRQRALEEAETNVSYLQQQLAQTNVVTLQQAVGRLLESELQKLMLARGTLEFAFRVIDSADPPKRHVRPKRPLIAVVGTLAGGVLGLLWVFLGHALRS